MKLRVKIDDQSYEVEVGDLNARPILASVDGEAIEVWPEETQAAAVTTAPVAVVRPVAPSPVAASAATPAPVVGGDRSKMVIAPIPGTIVGVAVKEGDSVKPGQELFSLEAMKMKNSIRATRAGQIGRVLVKSGDRVTQGQPLAEYAD
jgi:biotin carboxyl carrier protein